jgi:hypothetical protein
MEEKKYFCSFHSHQGQLLMDSHGFKHGHFKEFQAEAVKLTNAVDMHRHEYFMDANFQMMILSYGALSDGKIFDVVMGSNWSHWFAEYRLLAQAAGLDIYMWSPAKITLAQDAMDRMRDYKKSVDRARNEARKQELEENSRYG